MRSLNFHIRHEVTPKRALNVLDAIAKGQDFSHIVQADRQLGRLRQLELVDVDGNRITPTHLGRFLHQIGSRKQEVAFDLLHYLHYVRWNKDTPLKNTAFWSYKTYSNLLYKRDECSLNMPLKEKLTAELNTQIRDSETFGPYLKKQTRKGAVSISPNTLNGIQHWLEALTPPVIEANVFNLRYFCPPELLLLALAHAVHQSNADLKAEILLTPDKRDYICRVCLLNPHALDRSLDWMIPLYPQIIEPGTRTGSYGRFIRLLRMPHFEDFIL